MTRSRLKESNTWKRLCKLHPSNLSVIWCLKLCQTWSNTKKFTNVNMSESFKISLVILITFSFNFIHKSLTSMGLFFSLWLHWETKFLWPHCLSGPTKKYEPISQHEFDNSKRDSTELWRVTLQSPRPWFGLQVEKQSSATWELLSVLDTSWMTTQSACWLASQENIYLFLVLYNHSVCCVLSSQCGKQR